MLLTGAMPHLSNTNYYPFYLSAPTAADLDKTNEDSVSINSPIFSCSSTDGFTLANFVGGEYVMQVFSLFIYTVQLYLSIIVRVEIRSDEQNKMIKKKK